MPAQANATVTAVGSAGIADDWDRPAAAGAAKWEGEARAYYRETLDRASGGGAVNVVERRELILDTADVDAMALDTDDVITFTVDALGERTGVARSIRRARLAGVPGSVQTAKIILEDA